jgi:AcrR family transcriptional regulator
MRSSAPSRPAPTAARGQPPRAQLLAQATRLFAAKGYAATSTREICEAAGANVAAIHYYFGDKEGLYREVLLRPVEEMTAQFGDFADPALPFAAAMRLVLAPFVAPAGDESEQEAQAMRLHLREMLEPTPVFREIVAQRIVPVHQALCTLLAHHCGAPRVDEDIHQLAFAMVAIANDYCMSREFMRLLAPRVLERSNADALILDRLVGYCEALLAAEVTRRGRRTSATRKLTKARGVARPSTVPSTPAPAPAPAPLAPATHRRSRRARGEKP